MSKIDIDSINSRDLLILYSDILEALLQRGITRSNNNPIGDYAESLAAKALGLSVEKASNKGYDAVDRDGQTYEIKARRITKHNGSRMLSAIRQLDENHFDFLIGILFNADFTIQRACLIPCQVVKQIASYRKHTNAWIVRLEDHVWSLDGVRDITRELTMAVEAMSVDHRLVEV